MLIYCCKYIQYSVFIALIARKLKMKLPTLFISHGAPTLALEPGRAGVTFAAVAKALPTPQAVLVISAHWETSGIEVTSHPRPETIHDFGGFPPALYALQYPAPGAPAVAERVVALLAAGGFPARANPVRGLDHGAWVPLLHFYPDADVPVLQLSLPHTAAPQVLVEIGRALQTLREEGVLIVASGGITHNLYEFRMGASSEEPYAREFMEWFAEHISAGDLPALIDYRRQAPAAARAHPSDEHLRPFYIALGAAGATWHRAIRLDGGVDFGVIGMDAYAFGVSDAFSLPIAHMAKEAVNEQV